MLWILARFTASSSIAARLKQGSFMTAGASSSSTGANGIVVVVVSVVVVEVVDVDVVVVGSVC